MTFLCSTHPGPWRYRVYYYILRLLFLFNFLLPAAAPAQNDAHPGFRRFNVEDGLSQGTINTVFQDHNGFIWIGTLDGLNRFDGIEFKTYRHAPGDTSSLSDSWITSIHEDEEHRLWIGTFRGLNEFDRRTETFRRYTFTGADGRRTMDYPVLRIQSAVGSSAPDVFVDTRGFAAVDRSAGTLDSLARDTSGVRAREIVTPGGAWSWSGGSLYAMSSASRRAVRVLDLRPNQITAILPAVIHGPGELLIATREGLLAFDPATDSSVRLGVRLGIRSILPDGPGRFWLATSDGLWILERSGSGWKAIRAGLDGVGILSMCRDSTGTVWAGSTDGLYRRQTSSPGFTVFRHHDDNPNSLASNFVMPVMEDRAGRIWFGTLDRGISVLTSGGPGGPSFRNYPKRTPGVDGPWGNNIRAILETRDGMVWMGTDGGLTLCGPGPRFIERFQQVAKGDSTDFWVDALYESRAGTLWAGAAATRLVRVDRTGDGPPSFQTFPLLRSDEAAPAIGVNVIVEGAGGELWVGTEAGLFRFDPRTGASKRYVHDPDTPNGLSNTFVWSLHIGLDHGREVLWVGTSQGLNRFDPAAGEWKTWFAQEGFPNDWVYGILRDDAGRLWLTTNRGITCFDDLKPEGRKFTNYDVTDGVAGNECNRRSYARLKGGDIIFGGTGGVTRFNPNRLSDNRNAPPVVLTSVLNAGRKLDLGVDVTDLKEIRQRYDENDLSFEFAALDYANPVKNQYACMMQGHDRDWISIGNRRFVSYAGLEPGDYVFRVKASNNDGVWNEQGIALGVVIEPPFWKAWWFIGSAVILLALAVVGGVRARAQRAREIMGIRRRIARDLHDEIGSNLTGIAVSGSLLKDSGELNPDQDRRVTDITSIAVKTSEMMRDLIWVIRPDNDRLDDLSFRMKDAAVGILAGVHCHFNVPADWSAHTLKLEVKHHLYLIYKEVITNIARHANAEEVMVTLELTGRTLVLTVSDDGTGFDTMKEAKGMGLKNLSHRASAIGGTIEIRSSPGAGTRTIVTVPIT
jgi:ligand-binding sensor domain-containing protein/signal transduction histidine kinase